MAGFDALKAEISEKLDPQAMRLLCGEMSTNEMLTAKALLNWVLRICDKHEGEPPGTGLDPDLARLLAKSAISKARQSHPDAHSSAALYSAEREIAAAFSPERLRALQEAPQSPQEAKDGLSAPSERGNPSPAL